MASAHQRPVVLLVNGIVLGAVATVQFILDFAGYWSGVGPTGAALHGNLDTLAFAEAHGLAAGFAILMILRRRDAWAGWHLTAALVHVLLGACNLVFWRLFETWDFITAGVLATAMHGVFTVLQLGAYFTGVRASRRPQ